MEATDAACDRGRRPRWPWVPGVALLAGLAFLGGRFAGAGDAGIAQLLLEAGKKAIEKKQYDDAVVKLDKALVEDPATIEAHYWIGFAQEKKGDNAAAVKAYRAFRSACTSLPKETRSKPCDALLKKAEGRLSTLAAAESELNALNDAFVGKVFAFAKANFLKDPALATKALEIVLKARPEHEEALRLQEKITGVEPPARKKRADPGPTGDVETWQDFLGTKRLGNDEGWTYGEAGLVIDRKSGGRVATSERPFASPKTYVWEIEAQFLERYEPNPILGIVFAHADERFLVAHVQKTAVVLWEGHRAEQTTLDSAVIEPVQDGIWHRLSVAVAGNKVEVFFDGKRLLDYAVAGHEDLAGDVGIFFQDSRTDIRMLRLGERK